MSAEMHGARRWPYAVGVAGCVVASAGLLYAPISGIVYPLALPGALLSAVCAMRQQPPARWALFGSAGLLISGAVLFAKALLLMSLGVAELGVVWYMLSVNSVFVFLIVFPVTALLLGVFAGVTAWCFPGQKRAEQRA